ncbi:2-keto-4-pentenoate hydratase [Sphingobium sp.]|uniref:2-keto-4-pentenoate hydratase n=1 Tax=Sphingobium sp. TaxID=1912891 RepID=UPI00262E0457|nr:2-keto-4-pentenoate hydratase [Sphingobium sp.]
MSASNDVVMTATAFVDARRTASGLDDYPGTPPATLDQGYAIQAAALTRVSDAVAGWKVGRILPPLSDQYGCDRLSGPIFASTVAVVDDDATGLVFANGFGAVEAEYLFRIGAPPLPDKMQFTLEEAAAHIDAVHIGIEIASSPFKGINSLGPAVTISDFGNNNGLLVGPAVPNWGDGSYAHQPVRTLIDGAEVGTGTAAAFNNGAIGSVRFLLENLAARGITVQAGWWISTGAVTGVHPARPGQAVETDFGPLGTLSCRIAEQEPR